MTESHDARSVDWRAAGRHDRFIQFYESRPFLLDSVYAYTRAGLEAGDVCVVIARDDVREGLARLLDNDIDLTAATAFGLFSFHDAGKILDEIRAGDTIDPAAFTASIGGVLAGAAAGGRHLRVLDEIVALLQEQGKADAVGRAEMLWNDLQAKFGFSLMSTSPSAAFARESADTARDQRV